MAPPLPDKTPAMEIPALRKLVMNIAKKNYKSICPGINE
jgi:hypothetical protein